MRLGVIYYGDLMLSVNKVVEIKSQHYLDDILMTIFGFLSNSS